MQAQAIHCPPATLETPADEVQHVRDYQEGWNDAQAGRPMRTSASVIYYVSGYLDGATAQGGVQ